ncbi:hypothetical protein [Pseudanabaena sp. PCC 6802]|uniref:hypothetical protein n=1 Tax=Pseudanabaena sp. PCC 6802 TaxID=118173 RepID=UPI0003455661|nr:hypothetical protein [Pseudanabaena sp. PCC 6802]
MNTIRRCKNLGIAAIAILFGLPTLAEPTAIQNLPDGNYIFSSKLPDRSKHPDIQLAGAEIYVIQKAGDRVFGEFFVANSSDFSCFRGTVKDSAIVGEALYLPFPMDSVNNKIATLPFQENLQNFKLLAPDSIPYAKGSIQRCRDRFLRYTKS